jgi:hypothetical protein
MPIQYWFVVINSGFRHVAVLKLIASTTWLLNVAMEGGFGGHKSGFCRSYHRRHHNGGRKRGVWSSLNLQGTFSLGRRWIGGYLGVGKGSEAVTRGV